MKIIAPMAGTGQRFVDKGYTQPKPLIKVNGKRIIEYIVDMFSPEDDFVFICNEKHLKDTSMKFVLQDICPNSTIVSMPMHKYGPVYTVQEVYNHIDDDEEVIVTYCDNPYIWDRDDFAHHVKDKELDGCILSHSGLHPHTLNNTKMAFMKTQGDLVTEIKEKECYTDNPMNEHASTGTYYFRKGSYIKKYFNEAMEKNIQYNGEYYVTLVYNLLIEDGLRVGYYDTPFATVMGTPEEVENIEAWNSIVNKGQVKNEDDLIACYRYWKAYHETGVV
tara:strand:+ start:89 stop:916 length:828 start_codon:yes stop_codon:yes gene_type:complete